MALDLSDDYLCVDLYEPVTLVSRATARGTHDETVQVARAFRRGLTYKELGASAGAAIRMETAFDVPATLTEGYTWKPGDTLTDEDDNRYNIYSAVKDPGTAFWSLVVFNPKIAYDLRHLIDVYRKEMTKDASGAAYSDYETLLYSDIACRVQWTGERGGMVAGRTGDEKTATIYCDERLYLDHNCIVKWTDPATSTPYVFSLEEWVMADRIDELMQIRAKVKP